MLNTERVWNILVSHQKWSKQNLYWENGLCFSDLYILLNHSCMQWTSLSYYRSKPEYHGENLWCLEVSNWKQSFHMWSRRNYNQTTAFCRNSISDADMKVACAISTARAVMPQAYFTKNHTQAFCRNTVCRSTAHKINTSISCMAAIFSLTFL